MSERRSWLVPSVDAVIALGFVDVTQLELHWRFEDGPYAGPFWWNTLLGTVFCLTLALRGSRPRLTLGLMSAVYLLPRLAAPHTTLFFAGVLPFLVAVYTVARHADGWWARLAWLGGVVCWLGELAWSGPHWRQAVDPILPVSLALAAWVLGLVLAHRAGQRERLVDALARLAAEQEAREGSAVRRERARIAGEMHDVVAHAVSLMVVQIGHARLRLERDGSVQPQLRHAEQTGRQALDELRCSVGVLR